MSNNISKNKSENNPLLRLTAVLSLLAGLMLVVLLVVIGLTDEVIITRSRSSQDIKEIKDYSCEEIIAEDTPIGVKKEYVFYLDEPLERDTNLAFYTVHQYVNVFLDGDEIYSMMPSEGKRISKTVGSNWTMLPIYREDAGKQIRVVITPVYESFRDREVNFLVGSQLSIYCDRLKKDLPQLILGIMALFVGVVFVLVAGYCFIRKHPSRGLAALGLFAVMMGVWRLMDTRFTPFMIDGKSTLVFYTSIAMLCFGMIPLIKWAESYFSRSVNRVMSVYCLVSSLVCLVQIILQFFCIADIRELLFVTHIIIGVGVLIVVGSMAYDHIRYPEKSRLKIGNVMPVMCAVGIMADIIMYYIKGNSSGLVFSLFTFLLYIVMVGIVTILQYSRQELILAEQERQLAEKDRLLAEQERRMTSRRISTMMSQIRSHFIFNVLTTISGYCKVDAKKADQALIRFSRYLRRNINIIEEEGTIPFDMELEQLEDYVALEQMRFAEKVSFVKNIETNSFKLPPLTIQPLVENAIKHGLVEHGRSGTICLSTAREKDFIVVTVSDDGVGFSVDACEKSDSVGIRNVRYRLENMVGGSLTIDSKPGEGTVATIRIPMQQTTE